jgi:hypothetical protein
MRKKIIVVAALVTGLIGCTDAFKADIGGYGKTHHVRMYNGGQLVAEWYSTGKVSTMSESDGWQFMDKKTRKLVRVGGDVIIEVID